MTPLIIEAILNDDVKIGIIEGELADEPIQWAPLWDEEIAVVVSAAHAWHEKETVTINELAGQYFVVREKGSLTRAWEEQVFKENGIAAQIIAEFDSPAAIKQAVASGLGIALLPCFAVASDYNLHTLRLSTGPLGRTLKLVWGKNSLDSQAVQAFISHLSNEFPHLPLQILDDIEELELLRRTQNLRLDNPTTPTCL